MRTTLIGLVFGLLSTFALAADKVPPHPYVKFETSEGTIVLELDGKPLDLRVYLRVGDGHVRLAASLFEQLAVDQFLDSLLAMPLQQEGNQLSIADCLVVNAGDNVESLLCRSRNARVTEHNILRTRGNDAGHLARP